MISRTLRSHVPAAALGVACLYPAMVAAQNLPPEPLVIDPALSAHVSADGLDALGASIGAVVPTGLRAVNLSGEFDCDEAEPGTLQYAADDIQIHLSADQVAITPSAGRLDVDLGLTVWSDPANITAAGICVLDLNESCTLELAPTDVNVAVGLELALVDGVIDASVDEFSFTYGNFGNPIAPGCVLGDALETMQGLGVDLIGSILDDVLAEQLGELETQLEELLNGLTESLALEDTLEALGATISYSLQASQLDISGSGLRIGFTAAFGALDYGTCIPRTGRYEPSSHDMPPLTGLIPDTSTPYHVGIIVNQDTVNQALHAVWQAGMLCIDVAEFADLDITTAFLEPAAPDVVPEFWPEPILLDVQTAAAERPVATFDAGIQLNAALLLNVFGPELDRPTRYWANGLFADAALGVALDGGALELDIGFDLDTQLGITVAYNEWVPRAVPEGFAGLIPTLVPDGLIPGDISFPLPSLYGLTLHALDVRVVGAEGDFLGVYGWVDPQQVESIEIEDIDLAGVGCGDTEDGGGVTVPGCEGDEGGCLGEEETGCSGEDGGGCGDCSGEEGCEDGNCNTAPIRVPLAGLMWAFLPLLVLFRRRR